jgi:hypothetical protein
MERDWVAGVTTISFRARYLSLLPWLIAEYVKRNQRDDGTAVVSTDEFKRARRRMEFVVLAATSLGKRWGESGNAYGVLGGNIFANHLRVLESEGAVDIPDDKGGASEGVYGAPAITFGILKAAAEGSPLRELLTPRGTKLFEARNAAVRGGVIPDLLFGGGRLDVATLEKEGLHYSANRLASNPAELAELRSAFFEPYAKDTRVQATYAKFNDTVRWALTSMASESARPTQRIAFNYAAVFGAKEAVASDVAVALARYDLHRRVHFALELLFHAFTSTLRELRDATGTVDEILETWALALARPAMLPVVREGRLEVPTLDEPLRSLKGAVDGFLEIVPDPRHIGALQHVEKALYATALLVSCERHSVTLRDRVVREAPYVSRAFEIVASGSESSSLRDCISALLRRVVIEAHLRVTLRKMSDGQKCSLRFFPEGTGLRATGIESRAGFSGTRLSNVFGMLADLGYCQREGDNSRFVVAKDGIDWLAARG